MVPFFDVYVAELDDPRFSWNQGDWSTRNIPRPISPFFPPANGREPLRAVIDRIKNGELAGKQTDNTAWVARVSIAELKKFMGDFYGDFEKNKYRKEIRYLNELIDKLDHSREYALVAAQD